MLYQLWEWWRLQGNLAGHNDAPKVNKKKKKKKKGRKKKKKKKTSSF